MTSHHLALLLVCICQVVNSDPLKFEPLTSESVTSDTVTSDTAADDLILDLPGLPYPASFRQFSGYLKTTGSKYLHYWLVESSRDPARDPLVVWYNGGPGCSSLGGFFNELGPFKVKDNGRDLYYNKYAWNQVANVVYVESPAGVGFSYSEDGQTATNDSQTATDNYWALKSFFRKFPEYKERDFYITGESYAGIYIPTLTDIVLQDPEIRLQGVAIGNGLLHEQMNDNSLILWAYFHGLVSDLSFARILRHCCHGNLRSCDFTTSTDWRCGAEVSRVNQVVNGGTLDRYNLYNKCVGGVPGGRDVTGQMTLTSNYRGFPFGRLWENKEHMKRQRDLPPLKVREEQACQNSSRIAFYLDRPDVRRAIHVSQQLPAWEECSSSLDYTKIYFDMTSQIQNLIKHQVRVLIYNGDVDMACNFLGDQWFVDSLNLKNGTQRREWLYTDDDMTRQIGGWTQGYAGLDFLTVRGSGHFVPTDRPRPALVMFQRFINNQTY